MSYSAQTMGLNSPTSKMKMLNSRWQQIQHQMDRQKLFRQQNLQQQLCILDNKLTHLKPVHHQKTSLLLQRIQTLKETSTQICLSTTNSSTTQQSKIKCLQQSIQSQIQNEKTQRNQKVQFWIKQSDQKLIQICNSLEEVTSEKTQTVQMITQRMKKRIFDLQQAVQHEAQKREINTTQLTQTVEKELNRMHSEVDRHRRAREDTNRKLVLMLNEVQDKLTQQVQQERRSRMQTNQALLSLLQQTCLKVQQAFY